MDLFNLFSLSALPAFVSEITKGVIATLIATPITVWFTVLLKKRRLAGQINIWSLFRFALFFMLFSGLLALNSSNFNQTEVLAFDQNVTR